MGIGSTLRKIGKGTIKDRCDKNPETGEVVCSRTRVNPDKTEVDVAGFTVQADADCNPIQTSSFENEDGALESLEKKTLHKIVGKCRNKPADY